MAQQRTAVGQLRQLTEEGELAGIVKRQQPGQEQTAEQSAQHAHRQEEGRAGRYPSVPVQRDTAARHDHVDVRMMGHGRAPGVEHGGDADARTQLLGIGSDGQHGLRGGLEQQVVEQSLVVERDGGDLGGQREHEVEIADRQQVGLARGEPGPRGGALALGAVAVAAGVVGDPPMAAVGAGLDVPAQRGGATVLDRRHDLELMQAQVPGMGGPISRPGSTEDVGNLERGAHRLSAARHLVIRCRQGQSVERADNCPHRLRCHLGVEGRGVELGMAEQCLDNADIDAVLEQMRRKTVP